MSATVTAEALTSENTLSPSDARELTERIRTGLDMLWRWVAEAYQGQAWRVLGYGSWDEYCTREFGSSHLRLPREDRAEVVASLRESGLSVRAIAAATGLGTGTVSRALSAAAEPVVGLSGVPDGTPEVDPAAAAVDLADVVQEPAASSSRVTGTDGKSYPSRPEAPARPLRVVRASTADVAAKTLAAAWRGVMRFDELLEEVDEVDLPALARYEGVKVRDALDLLTGVVGRLAPVAASVSPEAAAGWARHVDAWIADLQQLRGGLPRESPGPETPA